MGFISEWKDNYVVRQVKKLKLPEFDDSETVRREFIFSGKVQKVGFRLEVFELANRLGLTGWVENLENGDVKAQLQGGRERIDFLVGFMKSLKRARVDEVTTAQLDCVDDEKSFIIKE
jgi:acylphosphatase